MIDDPDAPEMIAAALTLTDRLHHLTVGRKITKALLRDIGNAIYDHRVCTRQNGVDFPKLVIMCVPRLNFIHLARADADLAAIRVHVINFARLHPQCTQVDLATAVMTAWPHIKPGDLVEEIEARFLSARIAGNA